MTATTNDRPGQDPRLLPGGHRASARLPVLVVLAALVGAFVLGVSIGPVAISPRAVAGAVLSRLPGLHLHPATAPVESAIVWDLRLPRVILAGLVGALLAASGAAYQAVLRNPLADPYLLGAAAGAGLGATGVIITGHGGTVVLPIAAFIGAVAAVAFTYLLAGRGDAEDGGSRIVLAGVAVAALLTAIQTYVQQQHIDDIRQIYSWILGSFGSATWTSVGVVLPYAVVSAVVLLAYRRVLDVLRVGPEEAAALGIDPARTRLIVVAAATLGTAAAVSVSGLIGFVGIVVPHAVRLAAHTSYRVLMPVAMVAGAAFMILVDLLARTVQAPSEVPIGVVTALVGAPFFLVVLRMARYGRGVL